jgi:heat shock protein HslJ
MKAFAWVVVVALTACRASGVPSPTDFRHAVAGVDWQLVELRGQPAPLGAGDRPATMRFDPDSARISGFSGCNRYFGTYTLDGDTPAIAFGAVGMTKMACAQGMELETQVGEIFRRATRYSLSDGRLTLSDGTSALASFARSSP